MRMALLALLVLGLLGALRIAAVAEASGVGDAHLLGQSFHVVGPGDTLWSIAAEVDSSASRPEVVQQLVSLNGGDVSVDLGEVVVLPDPSS